MRRRIIKQGNDTLTITLPKQWTSSVGLRPGDEIEVDERGRALLITTDRPAVQKRKAVDITDLNEFAVKVLSSLYRAGYDQVDVQCARPGVANGIQEIISERLLGFEVVNQGKNFCVIKNVSSPLEAEFDTLLKRTFLLLLAMGKDSLEAIKTGDLQALGNVRDAEMINNKLTSFCRRILNIKGYADYKQTPELYSELEEMEKIADEYKYLCEFVQERKGVRLSVELLSLYEGVNLLLDEFYKLYYRFSMEKTLEFWNSGRTLKEKLRKALISGKRDDVTISHYLLNITDLVFDMLDLYLVNVL